MAVPAARARASPPPSREHQDAVFPPPPSLDLRHCRGALRATAGVRCRDDHHHVGLGQRAS
ncbi:hypothetical protein DB761_15130, partial [Xanthomonas perforans]